jgi:hypothetical protein
MISESERVSLEIKAASGSERPDGNSPGTPRCVFTPCCTGRLRVSIRHATQPPHLDALPDKEDRHAEDDVTRAVPSDTASDSSGGTPNRAPSLHSLLPECLLSEAPGMRLPPSLRPATRSTALSRDRSKRPASDRRSSRPFQDGGSETQFQRPAQIGVGITPQRDHETHAGEHDLGEKFGGEAVVAVATG